MQFHRVNHRYKPIILIPYIALDKNIDFLLSNDKLYILTADNVKCEVIRYKEKHISKCIEDIKNIYGMSEIDFISKWVKVYDEWITQDWLIKIELKKIDE